MKAWLPRLLLLIVTLNVNMKSIGQKHSWILGTWQGFYKPEKNRLANLIISRLEIKSLKGSKLKGFVLAMLPNDSLSRIVYKIEGRIYSEFMMLMLKEVVYTNSNAKKFYWPKYCNSCDSIRYSWEKLGDSIILSGKRSCDSLCSIDARYSKILPVSIKPPDNIYKATGKGDLDTLEKNEKQQPALSYNSRPFFPLETYQVSTDSVTIRLMDNATIDGDTVTLIYNGTVVLHKLGLTAKVVEIRLPILSDRLNHLVLFAENEGSIPPNTAFVQVLYDDKLISIKIQSDLTISSGLDFISSQPVKQK